MRRIFFGVLALVGLAWLVAKFFGFIVLGVARFGWVRWTLQRLVRSLEEQGFEVHATNRFVTWEIVAHRGDVRITLRRGVKPGFPPFVNRLTIESGRLPRAIEVSSADAADRVLEALTEAGTVLTGDSQSQAGTVSTGDAWFDKNLTVRGDEAQVMAHLDVDGRALMERLARKRKGFLADGALGMADPGPVNDPRVLRKRIHELEEATRALGLQDRSVKRAIADNVRYERDPQVRKRNLEVLLRRFPESKEADTAAGYAIEADDPEVKLIAARHLGDPGGPTLVRLLTSPRLDRTVRFSALAALIDKCSPEVAAPGVQAALGARDDALVLEALGAARALKWAGLEPAIIGALGHSDNDVKVAAASALAEVGTLPAVEHLLPLTEGFFTSGLVKTSARAAIDQIRARSGPGEAGQLTLAPEAAGGLSVVGARETTSPTVPGGTSSDWVEE